MNTIILILVFSVCGVSNSNRLEVSNWSSCCLCCPGCPETICDIQDQAALPFLLPNTKAATVCKTMVKNIELRKGWKLQRLFLIAPRSAF